MRCKVCGAYNEDYLEFCENCAAPLELDAAISAPNGFSSGAEGVEGEPAAWGFVRSPSWPKPDFDANTVSEQDVPTAYLNRFEPRRAGSAQPAQAETPVSYVHVVEEAPPAPVSRFHASEPSPALRGAPVCGPAAEEEAASEPMLPVRHKAESKPRRADSFEGRSYGSGRRRKSRSKSPLMFYVAAGVLVLLIVVFGIALLTKGSGPIFGGLFSKSSITKQATIAEDTSDPAHKQYLITVYAKNGSEIRFTAGSLVVDSSNNPKMRVTEGKTSMIVGEDIFIPAEPVDSPTIDIYPDIMVVGKDGTEEKVTFEKPITIALPSIGLTLTSPVSPLETQTSNVSVSGTVDDNTASVFVGDTQLTVDETGSFSGTYVLTNEGASTIVVEARKNGYQIARATIDVNFTAPEAGGTNTDGTGGSTQVLPSTTGTPSFDFADSQSRRTTDATITVSGTAQSGTQLSVSGVDATAVTVNADGTFSFSVKMDAVGLYTATVTSSLNGTTGARTIYLERNHADKDAYIQGAHVLDYQYLMDSPHHKQAYKLVGKVTEILQTSPFVIAKVNTSAGDVLFYYYSGIAKVELNDGKTYEVYGDPNGKDSTLNAPILYAWYILKR